MADINRALDNVESAAYKVEGLAELLAALEIATEDATFSPASLGVLADGLRDVRRELAGAVESLGKPAGDGAGEDGRA